MLLNILVGAIVSMLLYLIYVTLIKPYFMCKFYQKQGLSMKFLPILGYLYDDIMNIEKTGDLYHRFKNLTPEQRKEMQIGFGGNIANESYVVLTDLDLIKDYANNDTHYYEKAPIIIDPVKELIHEGITQTEGPKWKRNRKLASSAFHFEFLKSAVPNIFTVASDMIENLKKRGNLNQIDAMQEFQMITGDEIGRLFLGEQFSKDTINGEGLTPFVGRVTKKIFDIRFLGPLYYVFGIKFLQAGILESHRKHNEEVQQLRAFILDLVKKKVEQIENEYKNSECCSMKKNLIHILVEQRKQNPSNALTDDEIMDLFLNFYVAGMDTTASLLNMSAYLALKHPECKEKILEEMEPILSNPSKQNYDEIHKLNYSTVFQKEVLRVFPPAPLNIPRVAIKDHVLNNRLNIKKGTIVQTLFALHTFDPEHFENPSEFNPDRFLEGKSVEAIKHNPYLYTPFWAGQRNCIGQNFAQIEAKVILGLFLKNFDYELSDKNYRLVMTTNNGYGPGEPIQYKLTCK